MPSNMVIYRRATRLSTPSLLPLHTSTPLPPHGSLFLKKLKHTLKIPVLALVDSDPYGLKILSVYMKGDSGWGGTCMSGLGEHIYGWGLLRLYILEISMLMKGECAWACVCGGARSWSASRDVW